MKVKVIFAQRLERYGGQYGIEALACMTEYDEEQNPEYLPEELEKARKGGEFKSIAIVTLNVHEGEIRKLLQPSETEIQARVIS